ncbi:Rha family transcriptional regulator [Devosia sp. 2618]|uniref:Rha family transcriptional regulator n=1 Tax=Devosia sp. 2618 TaxID=3156454 RepID=UPI003391116F
MTNLPKPYVTLVRNKAVTNSRHVAELFGKRHDLVLRDIDNLRSQGVLIFEETSYVQAQNRQAMPHLSFA